MKNKQKIFKPSLIVLFVATLFIVGGIYTTYFFKAEVINQQQEKLETEIDVLVPFVNQSGKLIIPTREFNQSIPDNERLTILDVTGTIIYDSSQQLNAKGSRDKRPEIQIILENQKEIGVAIRESQTIGEKYLYVAKGIYHENQLIGIMRLSEKYTGISSHLKQFQWNLFGVFLLIGLAVLVMYLYIIKQTKKPLQFILPILKNAIRHPQQKQAVVSAPEEWEELYQTVYELMDETTMLYYKQLQNETKLHFLFENVTIGIFILNQSLDVVLANRVTEQLFNQSFSVMPFDQWFQHQQLSNLIKEAKETQQPTQGDIKLTGPKVRYLNVRIQLLESDTDEIEYVGIIYDITDIRQIERLHEDFISNISHELKTPTTSIMGFAETLLNGAKDDPEVTTDFLTIIEAESQRLLNLIQNIMMLLKTEKDIYLLDSVSTSPKIVIEEELERYQYKLAEKAIKVTFDSAVTQKYLLPGNAFQLIVKNLLENAIEYSNPQGQIFIYLVEQEQQFIFTVEDTGVGISEKDMARIFERFYRVSQSRQRNTGGSGLGLSIVEHYVSILGGTVKLTSELGEGTTVIVKIPIESKE
ncbi:hypothetical protein CBF34_05605 [Vagococcus penaei]|uniref:histidine kinase n=1 Tax=Vagococcus penaei TaxID=633807 RepID=A0A1Q2D3N0_9ENTE|nr:ATP-binding protein [Vagococcus penaei]AQP52989.1 hypothetical protein BW732_01285 [Vagococcus penaei]RSU02551.1 hypothetical protein CBF34_05605 [Vagococcus penaei]